MPAPLLLLFTLVVVESDDDDVKVAAESEPDDVKVTVHELVTVFSDPIGAEVDPTEVVPPGENLRLSLYHRNRTKQGKNVARVMSNLRSDRVELFSVGKDMAEEIEIDVINTVLLENEDYCDAAHLYIYSDADAGDVADETDDAYDATENDGATDQRQVESLGRGILANLPNKNEELRSV